MSPVKPNTVTRTILTDKEGMLGHLRARLEIEQANYDYSKQPAPALAGRARMTQREQQFHRGYLAGLLFAIAAIEDWVVPSEADLETAGSSMVMRLTSDGDG